MIEVEEEGEYAFERATQGSPVYRHNQLIAHFQSTSMVPAIITTDTVTPVARCSTATERTILWWSGVWNTRPGFMGPRKGLPGMGVTVGQLPRRWTACFIASSREAYLQSGLSRCAFCFTHLMSL